MGEGGVACAPSQRIMERLPIPESLCGGKYMLASNPFTTEKCARNGERKGESGGEKDLKLDKKVELEKGEFVLEKHRKGELEEGELLNGELEKEELRNGEIEKGEFVPRKLWKSEVVVGGRRLGDEVARGESFSDRRSKSELERGEFVPDKWKRAAEPDKTQGHSSKGRKADVDKNEVLERLRKHDWDYSPESSHQRSDRRPSDIDSRKRPSLRWDGGASDRDARKLSGEVKHDRQHSNLSDHSGSRTTRRAEEVNRSGNSYRCHRTESSSASSKYSSSRLTDPSFSSGGTHDRQCRSPGHSEKSSKEHSHHSDSKDHSPRCINWSPHEKSRRFDHRDHTPSRSNRSPHSRVRHHGHRDRTPMHSERSPHPHDIRHSADHRESSKKNKVSEKLQSSRNDDRVGGKDHGEKNIINCKSNKSNADRSIADKLSKEKLLQNSNRQSIEIPPPPPPPHLPPPPPPPVLPPPPPSTPGAFEDASSMEEDMDISDTPPRDPISSDFDAGKWFYLDHFGTEQGPSKLVDLKWLVDNGVLLSDHLIKHADSDRWVTVENAVSPLVTINFPSIVSDVVTQMVSPPEAPGNLLVDAAVLCQETSNSMPLQQDFGTDEPSILPEPIQAYHIDERVEMLLDGYSIVDGKELEIIGEALSTSFGYVDWENWCQSEGFSRFKAQTPLPYPRNGVAIDQENFSTQMTEIRPVFAPSEMDHFVPGGSCSDWFSGRWFCKGGDWKRNDEVNLERSCRRKFVINEGYPLCKMPKSDNEDPRRQRKDDLYYPSRSKRLDLPVWSFASSDDNSDNGNDSSKNAVASRSIQTKPLPLRAMKGIILPVVRINACVVNDHVSSEPSGKVRSIELHPSRSSRSHSSCERNLLREEPSRSKKAHEHDLQMLHRCQAVLNVPRDRICTIDDLSVDLGDWFYLDGASCEHGPFSYLELQDLVGKGTILEHSSVFRKNDNTWLPITKKLISSKPINTEDGAGTPSEKGCYTLEQSLLNSASSASHSLHDSHPQFVGFTRGKLHELVMRSYKNREFAAAINEVLDPWIIAKQPKKEMDKHFPFNSAITKSSAVLAHNLSSNTIWKSEDVMYHDGKRPRLLIGDSDEDSEMGEAILMKEKLDLSFEDLYCESDIFADIVTTSLAENENWGLLNAPILARTFHFLKSDMKSLVYSAATCKHWNTSVNFYRNICKNADLSSVGPKCTDAVFRMLMGGFGRKNLTSISLMGCVNVTTSVVEEVLQLFPHISFVDIRGCCQFKELQIKYPKVMWIGRSGSAKTKFFEESHSKTRSLRQIAENNFPLSRTYRSLNGYLDDSDDLGNFAIDEPNSFNRNSISGLQFKQGFYKRPKLLDSRRSSELLSRDAQMRRWLHRKSENSYKKMEEFIASSLRSITRGSKSEIFIPKISKIEDRMKSGYYVRHGLSSIKDDISRMCCDAFKSKRQNDGDMKKIIFYFLQLIKKLDNPRLISERDEMAKAAKDNSDAGAYISEKYKKKQNRTLGEKKATNKSAFYCDGGTDNKASAFDREIKRSLSKLKKRDMDSESETSEEHENDFSDEDERSEDESTASDTESDMEVHTGNSTWESRGDFFCKLEESIESAAIYDREWGARMTKAGLVPPVTRKYEIIDKYLIVADREEVRRKMQVALPDDYSDKLLAQKNGIEESDMEIPEVKEYKPRKSLGVEVIEQEVYGIDPYTHNLLLDTMPDEPEWTLTDRHTFIDESILRTLNKQVRQFTGSGNTPMVYPLRPVLEEMQMNAEEGGDKRSLKMCQAVIKAMRSRPDDNYVSYRKGLGVVCNKKEGFEQDDFVVEFLGEVYPAWKWYEKQDGIRSLQKNSQEPAPEFYNIYLERPKGDLHGYDLVVVDAMHKANYASRICHSCRPNCEAKVTAVDGQYQIGIYSLVPIGYGEEITFDYNSVTESKEEYEASVCLCGSQVCRGSYLNLAGEGAFEKVLRDSHGVLDRHKLMLEACDANIIVQDDYLDLARAGLGPCLLDGLPDWLVAYSAHLVRFINFERKKLPDEILKHNLEEKRKFFSDICLEVEKNDAEIQVVLRSMFCYPVCSVCFPSSVNLLFDIQAEGVYNARLQNIALTLNKVKYVMRCVFEDAKNAPPPIEKLTAEGMVSVLWKGEGSLVEDLLHSMTPHLEPNLLIDLKSNIQAHDPSGSDNIETALRKSLLWLRDELRNFPCSKKCRHDAAADLIHIYAYTKVFFKIRKYKSVTSPPVYISPLDLGPKYADKMGSGFQEYCKTYGENYCLGQLIYWYSQMNADPDCRLVRARKGCLSLPDFSSYYAKTQKPLREHYSLRTVRFMMSRMEKEPQRPWPKDRIWLFKSNPKFFGSPMLDAVLNKCPLDKEMMHWLKTRPAVFQG
ncbi:histone-lysine N-methyltransferase ATXR3-like isoform X1 [Zingiber officinale]|uniref:histone-lysine N-methyltransferase ATXR3-like isoform X1 n=1 Tax=Zingiber officinale TaxID=94328 RepID=UPI001C4C9671|nr:histone-lysine N-methyltransferase ATXR3-like isoform X1 [Zingiber officinale]